MGRSKQWEDKVLEDTEELQVGNWRKMSLERSQCRETINKDVYVSNQYIKTLKTLFMNINNVQLKEGRQN